MSSKERMNKIRALADSVREKVDSLPDLDLEYTACAKELFTLVDKIDSILAERELTNEDKLMIQKKLKTLKKVINNNIYYKKKVQ